jgi:hypothetical protein
MILIRRPEMSFVSEARKRQSAWRARTRHMIRLRHEGRITGQDANEIILINAHDGASSDPMPFRFVCHNGMVCGDTLSNPS